MMSPEFALVIHPWLRIEAANPEDSGEDVENVAASTRQDVHVLDGINAPVISLLFYLL